MIALRAAHVVVRYELSDLARSRWLIGYALFFGIATDVLFRFTGADGRAFVSLMNVILLIVPLTAVAFGTMHFYNRRELVELLLAQPLERHALFVGLYLGLALPLASAVAVGLALPGAVHGAWTAELRGALVTLIGAGIALTLIFTAIALYVALRLDDKVRGLAASMAVWLCFALLYDGLVLVLASTVSNLPLERPLLGLMLVNPIDLARLLLLLRVDISALMGYTGALFERAFGSMIGSLVAAVMLLFWIGVPTWLGARAFARKNF